MTPRVRNFAVLLSAAVLLLGLKFAINSFNRPTDEVLIQQALAASIEASRKGEPGGVIDMLSQQLKVNQQLAPDTSEIKRFIKASHPEVTLSNTRALVTGNEARIVSPVNLKFSFLGQTVNQPIDSVTLVFQKEEAREFLFLPVSKWRLIEVRMPENQVPTHEE